jgi:outer membrane protein assembly factor BamB
VWGDLMIAHYDGTDKQFVAALRIADGKLAWLTERSGKMNEKAEFKKAYCTPMVVRTERGEELVSPGADWVYGYDPATGKELWKAAYGELGFSTVPRPVIGHGMAYVCTSFMRSKLLAVKLGGSGDVTSSHVAWTSDSQITKKPSMALVGEELYMGNDTGIITCFDALTGKEIWRERIGGNFSASPLLHDGLIYFFSEEGKATVIRAGRKFEVVAVNELGDGFTASPAVVDGALFLRSQTALYRIDPPK